jgi:hypothetical protein
MAEHEADRGRAARQLAIDELDGADGVRLRRLRLELEVDTSEQQPGRRQQGRERDDEQEPAETIREIPPRGQQLGEPPPI